MTAWVKSGTREQVGIITDFTDEESVSAAVSAFDNHLMAWCLLSLTAFNKKLVEAYLDIPWVETKCGYACSDQ